MEDKNPHPAWMDDELVQKIEPKKLDFASRLFSMGHGKSQKEMMNLILPMLKQAKAENLTFTQAEINACIQAVKKHSTKEELEKIDRLMSQEESHRSAK